MFSCSKDKLWVIIMAFRCHQSTVWPFENYNFIVYNLFLLSNISFYYHYKSCLFLKDFDFQIAINEKLQLFLGQSYNNQLPMKWNKKKLQ